VRTRSIGISSTQFAIWDPSISPFGGYIITTSGISTPKTTNYPYNLSADTIQSGQAFLLYSTSTNPSISFLEIDKIGTTSSSVFARPAPPVVHIQLRNDNADILDGVAIGFADNVSAIKLTKPGEEISIAGKYAIQLQPLHDRDTFYIEFSKLKHQTYHLRFEQELQNLNVQVHLIDRFMGIDTILTHLTSSYAFNVTADSLTFHNRFKIVSRKVELAVESDYSLKLMPNPVQSVAQVYLEKKAYSGQIQITDVLGRTVMVQTINNGRLDIAHLKRGVYYLVANKKSISFIKE
jgi:hypothetical protein